MIKFNIRSFDLDSTYNPDATWQVVYKTKEGLDYCRDTMCRHVNVLEVLDTAVAIIKDHNLGGAEIQYF